nr:hypothetical protein [Tanacetum cinerariifolium]
VIKGVQKELGYRIVRVESVVTALTKRVTSWKGITGGFEAPRVLRVRELTDFSASCHEVKELVAQRVAKDMEAREATRNLATLNENGDDQEGENVGNENGGNRGNGNRG